MINKAENRFVFVDTETGGVIPEKHSLLSIGLVIWDKKDGIIDKKEFFVKHSYYIVTEKAKEINKFEQQEHKEKALAGEEVIKNILEFIYGYFDKNTAIPLIGHNVQFDINFLKVFFRDENRSFNQYFSHRSIDTYSVFKSLVLAGVISDNIDSSADAFRYFDIKVNNRHSAIGDCVATVELFEKLLLCIKRGCKE
ncbi:DNA polymerase-3 subunit epsilon [Lachnotalea glycerini]|uniref:DNA polymerase-3 subunit epsilon n=1 Tax=Lachnotalea glycerini TaxID=1763509 RepID=A0A318EUI5_9FIRM|nr:3'-5' exonuclease [Lachnotalea glycerini]PXV93383.1 DNA polymerase-3 subunit epsilon [Lachnotalea glycerini]